MNQPKSTLVFCLSLILAISGLPLFAQQNNVSNTTVFINGSRSQQGMVNTNTNSNQSIINTINTGTFTLTTGGSEDSSTTSTGAGQVTTGTTYNVGHSNDGGPILNTVTTNTNCPMMYVDVNIPYLQSCVQTSAVVSYCNHGNANATNSYVDVTFDAVLTLDSASLPYTFVSANVYRFQLGTVLANDCGSLNVFFTTVCDSALIDDQHCIHAHIYPDTLCASVWNNYLINLSATCFGTEIDFMLTNKGTPITIAEQIRFIIIDDHLLVQGGGPTVLHQGILKLDRNQTETYSLLNISSSSSNRYKIEVRDMANNLIASSSVQSCTPTSNGVFSSYYVNQFWNGSPVPSEDLGCAYNGHAAIQANTGNSIDYDINNDNNISSNNASANNSYTNELEVVDNQNAVTVQVVPNPFLDHTTIILNGSVPQNYTFRLYDITGRTIEVQHLVRQQEFRVERNNLLSGIYIYQIETDGRLIGAGKIVAQ